MLISRFRVSLASKPYYRKYTRGVSGAHAHRHVLIPRAIDEIDNTILQAAKDPVVNDLAEKILAAERELSALFEPGKLMPSVSINWWLHWHWASRHKLFTIQAGKVAKMRQSIMDMKGLLASKLNGMESPNPDAADGEAERARKLFFEVRLQVYLPTDT